MTRYFFKTSPDTTVDRDVAGLIPSVFRFSSQSQRSLSFDLRVYRPAGRYVRFRIQTKEAHIPAIRKQNVMNMARVLRRSEKQSLGKIPLPSP